MRIFSVKSLIILGFILTANGHVMDHLPQPLMQLLGKGIAQARSDRFDMHALLMNVKEQQDRAFAAKMKANQFPDAAAQPFNFVEGGGNDMRIQSMPLPAALDSSNSMSGVVQEAIKQVLLEAVTNGAI